MKRERGFANRRIAATSGRITWTANGIADCMRHVQNEALLRKTEEPWEPCTEAMIYLVEKYGVAAGMAHGHRMVCIMDFLSKKEPALQKAGVVRPSENGAAEYSPALFQALARLPFDYRSGFDLERVLDYAIAIEKPS